MKYMLDTNICIFIIKKDENVLSQLKNIDFKKICISSITLSELEYGVAKSMLYEKNKKALEDFVYNFSILPFDNDAAQEYGKIRADLEKIGNPIGSMDMLIAAHAKSQKLILVTNNIKEFIK
ncbi:MAG: type II toxin-antitoxin system VapC family toxin, partial [Mucispirillum sp.]|nr:type II toxin-antitoxin system VapC family toxin [Mucispirillum sp.]